MSQSLHVLLVPAGTPGDVQPFVDLGVECISRGHRVTLLAHDFFRIRAEQHGFGFASIGSIPEYETLLKDKNLWNQFKAHRVFAKKLIVPTTRRVYQKIVEQNDPGRTVVAAQSMAAGARIAQDKHRIPTATIHRQPTFLRSVYDSPATPLTFTPRWLPGPVKGAQYRFWDMFIDHPYLPEINALRAELALPKVKRWTHRWMNSPDLVIGFWPDWFAPIQGDWPDHTKLVGFIAKEQGERAPSDELLRFIESGEPPIVFTFGSGMRHGQQIYRASAEACRALSCRGLLVTSFADQVPQPLPPNVMHTSYAPFSWLLPRASAIVYHGGIGTAGQAVSAGVPQLIVPGLVFDTIDTAQRLRKLGVARMLPLRKYQLNEVTTSLRTLLSDETLRARCAELAKRSQADEAPAAACHAMEQLIERQRINVTTARHEWSHR
jgi:UDP:flavonoid glycosyltransferase YjiC (YdhE family)